MKKIVWITALICVIFLSTGCTSKLVKIDSSPAFANIWVNNTYIGKTPVYYKFTDRCYPWPIEKTDDYVVKASLDGYESETQIFLDSPPLLDISYVPNEIFFALKPETPAGVVK